MGCDIFHPNLRKPSQLACNLLCQHSDECSQFSAADIFRAVFHPPGNLIRVYIPCQGKGEIIKGEKSLKGHKAYKVGNVKWWRGGETVTIELSMDNYNTFLVPTLCLAGIVRDGALYGQEVVP